MVAPAACSLTLPPAPHGVCRASSRAIGSARWSVSQATRAWSEPTTPARAAISRRLFPLATKLRLRQAHWSEGAARVAAREGLQAPSFDLAADAFRDAVGARTSGESVRRVTEGWGKQREAGRAREAARAMALAQKEERPDAQRLPLQDPIVEQANLAHVGSEV